MHSIQDILLEIRKDSNLCMAIESGGIICYSEARPRNKYCSKHLSRYHRLGCYDLPKKIKKCKFIDCDRTHRAKGFCQKHYVKHVTQPKNALKICKIDKCKKNRQKNGAYCSMHTTRLRIYGSIEERVHTGRFTATDGINAPRPKKRRIKCIAPNCHLSYIDCRIVKGLCTKHYSRWQKWGDYHITSKKEYLTIINKKD